MALLRSLLFVPGNKENMLEKALTFRPDAFIPDMEDSVPTAEKANAREVIKSYLPKLAASGVPIIPRVNSLDTDWIEADLAAVEHAKTKNIAILDRTCAHDLGKVGQPDADQLARLASLEILKPRGLFRPQIVITNRG